VTLIALTKANGVLITFSTPNPSSMRTCARSLVTRLMISPVLMCR
jgi:hypothetical protein